MMSSKYSETEWGGDVNITLFYEYELLSLQLWILVPV